MNGDFNGNHLGGEGYCGKLGNGKSLDEKIQIAGKYSLSQCINI